MLTDSEERSLETLMESYKRGTSHEIALLTLPDLDGASLEALSLEVARTWGLGGVDANNGALLLISRDDRKMRIEVGRGLEGNLTDSVSGRIIRDVISPPFKQGRFETGIRSGIVAMHAAIGGDYGPIEASERAKRQGGSLFRALLPLLVLIFFFLGNKGNRGGRGGSNLPLWILLGSSMGGGRHSGGSGGGGFSGFGGGGGFSGGGASGGW
ncbi:MAG: hypothetical protein ACI9D0_001370 [Bacteroidia bacterium]|jgi:uncharacterized protein